MKTNTTTKYAVSALLMLSSLCACTEKTVSSDLKEIRPEHETITLQVGESTEIRYALIPSSAAEHTQLTWDSSDGNVATVSQDGILTAISAGNTNITISADEITTTIPVTVNEPAAEYITLTPATSRLSIGESMTITAQIFPEEASHNAITWHASDKSVVEITPDGSTATIKATAAGHATVYAECGTAAAACEITVTSQIRIGDFYYMDGTTSHELDDSKELVGIVFWTGDPGKDDAILKAEHPECVNGLVVSVKGNKQTAWQLNYPERMDPVGIWIQENAPEYTTITTDTSGEEPDLYNKMMGYNNTKAIEVFNDSPYNQEWPVLAVEAIREFRSENPSPESSSGWYLPSTKELSLLCSGDYDGNIADLGGNDHIDNFERINGILKGLENADKLNSTPYWSSNESDTFYAYSARFSGGWVGANGKTVDYYSIRAILAF